MNTAQKRVLTNQNLSILLTILARFVSYAGRFNPSNIFGFRFSPTCFSELRSDE